VNPGLAERYSDGYFATVSGREGATRLKALLEAQAHEMLDSAMYDR
jgi:hypothetical protein